MYRETICICVLNQNLGVSFPLFVPKKHLKMSTQLSIKRPKSCRPMDVRLLNHKEDVQLQWKLLNIRAKYRLNLRLLEQERELVLKEHKRLLNLRVCEPHATITNTMRAISDVRMTNETRFSKSAPAYQTSILGENL